MKVVPIGCRLLLMAAVLVLPAAVGCELAGGGGSPHTMTGATGTAHAPGGLPPKSDTYKVIGRTKGIDGYVVKYSDRLYRGGCVTSEEGMKALAARSIKTIVSITPDDAERRYAKQYGVTLVEAPFAKDKPVPDETLQRFLKAVRNASGPVYVHCHGGNHRGGTLAAAYRAHIEGWDWDKTLVEFGRLGGSLKDDDTMLESVRPANP